MQREVRPPKPAGGGGISCARLCVASGKPSAAAGCVRTARDRAHLSGWLRVAAGFIAICGAPPPSNPLPELARSPPPDRRPCVGADVLVRTTSRGVCGIGLGLSRVQLCPRLPPRAPPPADHVRCPSWRRCSVAHADRFVGTARVCPNAEARPGCSRTASAAAAAVLACSRLSAVCLQRLTLCASVCACRYGAGERRTPTA